MAERGVEGRAEERWAETASLLSITLWERERERERESQRQRERQRQRETERDRDRETERERQRQRERETTSLSSSCHLMSRTNQTAEKRTNRHWPCLYRVSLPPWWHLQTLFHPSTELFWPEAWTDTEGASSYQETPSVNMSRFLSILQCFLYYIINVSITTSSMFPLLHHQCFCQYITIILNDLSFLSPTLRWFTDQGDDFALSASVKFKTFLWWLYLMEFLPPHWPEITLHFNFKQRHSSQVVGTWTELKFTLCHCDMAQFIFVIMHRVRGFSLQF